MRQLAHDHLQVSLLAFLIGDIRGRHQQAGLAVAGRGRGHLDLEAMRVVVHLQGDFGAQRLAAGQHRPGRLSQDGRSFRPQPAFRHLADDQAIEGRAGVVQPGEPQAVVQLGQGDHRALRGQLEPTSEGLDLLGAPPDLVLEPGPHGFQVLQRRPPGRHFGLKLGVGERELAGRGNLQQPGQHGP